MTTVNRSRDARTWSAGAWGFAFVVLLLVGAGMATVPGGDESVAQVRRFYDEHSGLVLLSQVVELVATVPLAFFVVGLAASPLVRARRDATLTGGGLVAAAVLTSVPPLLLVQRHADGPSGQLHALAVLSDLSDVLLFASIAAFAAACGWAGHGPRWLRWLGSFVALTAGIRAVEILLGGSLLEVVAPVGFLLLVVGFSVVLLRRGGRATSATAGGSTPLL